MRAWCTWSSTRGCCRRRRRPPPNSNGPHGGPSVIRVCRISGVQKRLVQRRIHDFKMPRRPTFAEYRGLQLLHTRATRARVSQEQRQHTAREREAKIQTHKRRFESVQRNQGNHRNECLYICFLENGRTDFFHIIIISSNLQIIIFK